MERLVCAATWAELCAWGDVPQEAESGLARQREIGFLLTGVGIPCALAAVLETAAREQPAQIINIGIAGAYPGSGLAIGDLVTANSEIYGDIGFELPEPPHFRSIQESPFGAAYQAPFCLQPWPGCVHIGRGCTVNACTGTDATGAWRERYYSASFETMEGAAVAQAGARLGIPVCEVRAISNIAARRSISPDGIRLALGRLTAFFGDALHD